MGIIAYLGGVDRRTSEDCLFLDVIMPKPVFDAAQKGNQHKGIPVLVWIYVISNQSKRYYSDIADS